MHTCINMHICVCILAFTTDRQTCESWIGYKLWPHRREQRKAINTREMFWIFVKISVLSWFRNGCNILEYCWVYCSSPWHNRTAISFDHDSTDALYKHDCIRSFHSYINYLTIRNMTIYILPRFLGPLPLSLLHLKNLQGLYLYDNKMTGNIPQEITKLKKLSGILIH